MRINKLVLIFMAFVIAAGANFAHAKTDDGVRDGAGGDGKYVNGILVIRDFLDDEANISQIGVDFVQNVPGFTSLISDLAQVYPEFALKILDQLVKSKIWLTKKPLPLLPESVTSVTGEKADVQIAVRFDNDIIISEPAFNSVPGAYILLHEALHGVIPGVGPIHHSSVKAVVRYIYRSRKKLERSIIEGMLKTFGDRSELVEVDSPLKRDLLRALIDRPLGDGPDADSCSIFEFIKNAGFAGIHFNFTFPVILDWSGFHKCSTEVLPKEFDLIKKMLPITSEVVMDLYNLDRTGRPYVHSINSKPSWWEESWRKEKFSLMCSNSQDPNTRKGLQEFVEKGQKILPKINSIADEQDAIINSTGQDLKSVFARVLVNSIANEERVKSSFWVSYGGIILFNAEFKKEYLARRISSQIELGQKYLTTLDENIKLCK